MKDKLDKRTVIVIDWQKDGNEFGLSPDETGDTLPRELRVMFVNTLLRALGDLQIQVER